MPFSVMSHLYPEHLRAKLLASLSGAWVLPSLFGPMLAGAITRASSWHMVFYSVVPLLVVVGILTLGTLQQQVRPARTTSPFNWRRLSNGVALAAGGGILLAGLSMQEHPLMLLVLVLGFSLTVYAAREVFPSGLFRLSRGIPAGIVVRGGSAFAFFGAEAFMPLGLTELHGFSLFQAGLLLTVGGVTWTVGSTWQARMDARSSKHLRSRRVFAGMVMLTLGVALVGVGLVGLLPVWTVVLGWTFAGLGMGLGYSTNSLVILSQVQEGESGKVSSQLNSAEVLLAALAAGIGGALIAWARSGELQLQTPLLYTFGVLIGVSLLTWLAATRILEKRR